MFIVILILTALFRLSLCNDTFLNRETVGNIPDSYSSINSSFGLKILQSSMIQKREATENNRKTPEFSYYMIGGTLASRNYPFMVSLRRLPNCVHFCGGSIISSRFVLTAAHCFCQGNFYKEPEEIIIAAGSTSLISQDATFYSVEQTICHEEYHQEYQFHDVALVKSNVRFQFSNHINKIEMLNYISEQDIIPVKILGWGSTRINGDAVMNLRFIIVQTMEHKECSRNLVHSELSEFLKEWNICTYHPEKRGCSRDSGGPVIYKNSLLGLVSWSADCNYDSPDVHTSVPHHYKWITEQMHRSNIHSMEKTKQISQSICPRIRI